MTIRNSRSKLSICAIMKNEGPYLIEWLEFHKLMGVERFYLYDNCSNDCTSQILDHYITLGEVVYHFWPQHPGQVLAYNHCLKNYHLESDWIAFLDLDEFLFPTVENNLLEVLEKFPDVPGVVVNWLIFGTSGHNQKPAGLQIENFNHRAEDHFGANLNYKSIVKPTRVLGCDNPHYFMYKEGDFAVTENQENITAKITASHAVFKLRINHYFTRSWQEVQNKISRGRATMKSKRKLDIIKFHDRNDVEDLTIHRFIPQLKKQVLNIQRIIAHTTVSNRQSISEFSQIFPISEKFDLAICAIMGDDIPHLMEWLEFHKLVGVERFYLYDNNSKDNTIDLIAPYVDKNEVVYHYWPERPGRMSAYAHCLKNYGKSTEWIAFIDLNEFLFPTEADDLKIVLQEFVDYSAVGVNWLIFGTSGNKKKRIGLQIEDFTLRAPQSHGVNKYVKSIVRPAEILEPKSPYIFQSISGTTVTENKEILQDSYSITHSVRKLCINHYNNNSKKDNLAAMQDGSAENSDIKRDWSNFENLEIVLNQEEDLTIQRFLPKLKLALEKAHQIQSDQQSYTTELLRYEVLLEKYKFHLQQIESQLTK